MKKSTKKIVLVGEADEVEQNVLHEALKRGHSVIAVVPNANTLKIQHPSLEIVEEEFIDDPGVSKMLAGTDVMISVLQPTPDDTDKKDERNDYIHVTESVLEIAKNLGFKKIIATGYHNTSTPNGSKKLMPPKRFITTAQREALHLFESQKNILWSYIHVSGISSKLSRQFHKGDRFLFLKRKGIKTRIPVKSYASALIDEVERPERKNKF